MFKPDIKRLRQCPFYPHKEFFSLEEIEEHFVGVDLHIAEKLDGSPIYNGEDQVLYEDLTYTSSVDYLIQNSPRKIATMKYQDGLWVPFSSCDNTWFYSAVQDKHFLVSQTIKQDVRVDSVESFFKLIDECLQHQTMFPSKTNTLMEGIVVSTKKGAIGKAHNKEFMEILINAENKHKTRKKRS